MIKFAFQLLINLAIILPMHSQVTWFPHGAKWHYEYFSFWEGDGVTTLEVLNEDTLIGNNMFKRILSTTTVALRESNDSLVTYYEMLYAFENDQKVYGYDKWSGSNLLYDFHAEVGDTLGIYLDGFDPNSFIVDSIGLIDINGFQLKFQIIRFPLPFDPDVVYKMQFIEGIGSTWSHFFHSHTNLLIADVPVYNFRCYEDENIGLVNLYFPNIECDYIPGVSAIEPVIENEVSFYPNPAKDFLNVESKNQLYEDLLIVDLLGSVRIKLNNSTQKIDINQLEAGVYFVIGKNKIGQILFREKFCKFSD